MRGGQWAITAGESAHSRIQSNRMNAYNGVGWEGEEKGVSKLGSQGEGLQNCSRPRGRQKIGVRMLTPRAQNCGAGKPLAWVKKTGRPCLVQGAPHLKDKKGLGNKTMVGTGTANGCKVQAANGSKQTCKIQGLQRARGFTCAKPGSGGTVATAQRGTLQRSTAALRGGMCWGREGRPSEGVALLSCGGMQPPSSPAIH